MFLYLWTEWYYTVSACRSADTSARALNVAITRNGVSPLPVTQETLHIYASKWHIVSTTHKHNMVSHVGINSRRNQNREFDPHRPQQHNKLKKNRKFARVSRLL